jgi:hypothetical protein
MRHLGVPILGLVLLAFAGSLAPAFSQTPATPSEPVEPSPVERPREPESALRLFATVEAAWSSSDFEQLAGLVDTTVVRISVTPGSTPATALTRSAAAFLFQDQLRLVKTRWFRVTRMEVQKKGKAVGTARWSGDWGGRLGEREVQVVLSAVFHGNRWLLTEVRAND